MPANDPPNHTNILYRTIQRNRQGYDILNKANNCAVRILAGKSLADYMSIPEPSLTWQQERHRRILQDDVTAFAELCEQALPHLASFLQQIFPQEEAQQQEAVAIDTLLTYKAAPGKYNSDKLSLFAYLRMAARSDMLNAIDKEARREQRQQPIDDPNIKGQLPTLDLLTDTGELEEWLQTQTHLSSTQILQKLDDDLDKTDKEILLLMLEGVRDTESFAEVMHISHLPLPEQRAEVKRAKDRLQKRLERFGSQFRS